MLYNCVLEKQIFVMSQQSEVNLQLLVTHPTRRSKQGQWWRRCGRRTIAHTAAAGKTTDYYPPHDDDVVCRTCVRCRGLSARQGGTHTPLLLLLDMLASMHTHTPQTQPS